MKKLIITRRLNYPPARVYDAFTTAEALGAWWGPAAMDLKVLQFEFKPGGHFHYTMEMGDQKSDGLMEFISMTPPNEIQWLNSFADAHGNKIKPPFAPDFPLQIYNVLQLAADGEGTLLTLTGSPHQSTEAERQFFESMFESMETGFGGTLGQLEQFLDSSILS